MAELVVRLVFSLAVVLGLLLLTARLGARRFKGRDDAPVRVLHRQALSRTSSVTVVTVGSRVLVLGTTEQQVRVLAELDPDELDELGGLAADAAAGDEELAPVTHLVSSPPAGFAAVLHDRLEDAPSPVRRPASATPASARGRHAAPRPQALKHRGKAPATTSLPGQGALAGSVLSPQTWRQALQVLSRRAS